ncbi:MAG: pyridoxal-phosphate dependent enzyme, partial [Armatimonadetes bacterium]|nr:pyridoxal-phosphate dependent enzyme [Armatimonadota bacterium]
RSLAIGDPADGRYALGVARETGGRILSVTDEEIVEGIQILAEMEGVFTETAGGVTVGVLKRLAEEGVFGPDETVVAYITGMGLKTAEAVEDAVTPPVAIRPTLADFESSVLSLV